MSGGVAFVLDEDGIFVARCNTEMVELETVDGEDAAVAARARSRSTCARTGSRKARALLADWDAVAAQVRQGACRREYRRVLAEQAKMPETAGARRRHRAAARIIRGATTADHREAVRHG